MFEFYDKYGVTANTYFSLMFYYYYYNSKRLFLYDFKLYLND